MDLRRKTTTLLPKHNALAATNFIKNLLLKGRAKQRKSHVMGLLSNTMKTFTEHTISILLTDPKERNDATLKRLQSLTKEIAFFKSLTQDHSEEVHLECCKYMRYELAPESTYLFSIGEEADKFYVIVEGSVEVRIPDPNNSKLEVKLAEIKTGQSFGELALIKNQPRMASIYCTSPCHFATLSKADYNRILAAVFERQLDLKVEFLSSLQVFKDWTKMSMTKLSYYFRERKLGRKSLLYKEGAPVSKVFLVKKGELKIFKTAAVAPDDSLKNSPRQLSKSKRLDLAIVSTGEFLCIEDLIDANYQHSNSCESLGAPVEYFEIDAHVKII